MEHTVNLTTAEVVKRFNVSRTTLHRRVKQNRLKRNDNGTFGLGEIIRAGFTERSETRETPVKRTDVQKQLELLQKELDDSKMREERLMILLAQEQQNMQRLLSAGTPTPRRGFRDKIRQWWEGIQQTPES